MKDLIRRPKGEITPETRRYAGQRRYILINRLLYVLLFVTIQTAAVVLMFLFARDKVPYFYILCTVLSLLAAVHIINRDNNPAVKIAWLIPIFAAPIFGGLLYLMFGSGWINRRFRAISQTIRRRYREGRLVPTAEDAVKALDNRDAVLQSSYLTRIAGCPPFTDTGTQYFSSGEELYPVMLELLRSAKRYIFLEYFIIEEGFFWDRVLSVLEEKAAEGVDVRVLYDDFGCMLTLPRDYKYTLRQKRIRCEVFSPFNTILSPRPNNRDHRKICIVDGTAAIAGGINLADEYLNLRTRFGYWKDAAVLLRGAGAWGMTLQFLGVWDQTAKETTDPPTLAPSAEERSLCKGDGIVQPYTDIPMDDEQVGETVYFQMIMRAKRYVWITTPYLILDHDMLTALQTAAKSGVDVHIITPHIPDKRIVFFLTRSYYKPLLDAGVKISEYTPGFIHAKTMAADDLYAVVGSINLDYRSLYLHLENAVWMYNTDAVREVRDDFLSVREQSAPVTAASLGRMSVIKRLWLSVLRTFAPLL